MNKLLTLLLLVVPISVVFAQRADTCEESARTELEKVYCEVQAKSSNTTLPSLHEFRNNTEKTQRLLLRRPAKKLGLTLPKQPKESNNKKNKSLKQSRPKSPVTTHGATLAGICELNKESIICGKQHFKLLDNLPNNRLKKDALDEKNKLQLPLFTGNKNQLDATMPYLKQAYTIYIEHMVKIGLAASTMSFTKFYHTFMEVESDKVSFSMRLSTMFEYLKKDKASIGVQRRYNHLLPDNIENCSSITAKIVACDNVKQNWIYSLYP